ncbi:MULTISPECIES: hypothetical protein [unclassified Thiocapsa]|uniref:hypothetical protein n=1 Tax=unclassified Thiocapsa TaxID=2641286 RepID=UPI0035AF5032
MTATDCDTRSVLGKDGRDGFASSMKTCRKLGISFWDDLGDRIKPLGMVPLFPNIVREPAFVASATP